MNTNKHLVVALIAAVVVLFNACKKEKDFNEALPSADYDKALADALIAASGGEGISHFILPDADQFHLIPQDPTNPITHAKVELGKMLFHETGIAINTNLTEGMNTVSCASCHHAQGGFQAGRRQGIGEGGVGFGIAGEGRFANPVYPEADIDVQPLRSPSALNCAYQEVMLWNGQFGATGPNSGTQDLWPMESPIWNNMFGHQGVETQAIAGLGVHRMNVNEEICHDYSEYEDLFDICFPEFPQATRYSKRTAGLAIAAYERTLLSNEAPFQRWLKGDKQAMSDSEKRGAVLFFGKAECWNCHNGPALNSMSFHALGMNDMHGAGIIQSNPNATAHLGRGGFTLDPDDNYTFKTPQLYNLKDSPFYGHGGNFTSIREVVEYKNLAIPQNPNVPESQLSELFHPLNLTDEEITDLSNFIEFGLHDPALMRYLPNSLPSGNCFPNNDVLSQIDQGCIQ